MKPEPLTLDFKLKQHTFICAKSGGGKSYLAGVFTEEIIESADIYGTLILDPLGNLNTLKNPNINTQELDAWNRQFPRPDVIPRGFPCEIWIPEGDKKEFDPTFYDHTFSLKASQFSQDCLCYAFDLDLLDPQSNLYLEAQKAMLRNGDRDYDISELISYIRCEGKDTHGFAVQTIEALITRLNALRQLGIVSSNGIELNEMIQPQKVAVLDLSMSSIFTAKIVVSFLAERILKLRKRIDKLVKHARLSQHDDPEAKIPKPSYYIPPVQLIIDEAHNFLIKNFMLQKSIKEGRNVGFVITCISQSPDLNKSVFTNISRLFIGPVNYDDDIIALKAMVPIEIGTKEFRTQIKSLQKGCFWYYNTDEKIAKLIRVRPRQSFHPAETEIFDENKIFYSPENELTLEKKLLTFLSKIQYQATLQDIPMGLQQLLPICIQKGLIRKETANNQVFYLISKIEG